MYINFSNSIYFIYIFFIHFNTDANGDTGATSNFSDGIESKSQDGIKFLHDSQNVFPSKVNSEDDIIESLEKGILLTMLRRKPLRNNLRRDASNGYPSFPLGIESLEELPTFRLPDVYSAPHEFPKIEDHIFNLPINMEFPKSRIYVPRKDDNTEIEIQDLNNDEVIDVEELKPDSDEMNIEPLRPEKDAMLYENAHEVDNIRHSIINDEDSAPKNVSRNSNSDNIQVNRIRVLRFAKLNVGIVSEIIASFFLLAVVLYVKMVWMSKKMKNSVQDIKHKEVCTEEI